MKSKPNSLNTKQLQHFINAVAYIDIDVNYRLSLPLGKPISAWLATLQKLNFIASSSKLSSTELMNAPLLLAQHKSYGPILIRSQAKMLSLSATQILQLDTGAEIAIKNSDDLLKQLDEYYILIDTFKWQQQTKAEDLANYINKPMQGFLSQFMKLNFAVSLMISMLFMSGMDTLKFIVPSQSITTYANVGMLIIAIITSFIFGKFLMLRAQNWIDSVSQERLIYLRLSMLWSLPVDKEKQLITLCRNASQLAQLHISYKQLLGSCIALFPLAISIFSRLPFWLVLVPIMLTFIAAISNMKNRDAIRVLTEKSQQQLQQSQRSLTRFIQNIKPDLYYDRVPTAISQYQQQQIDFLSSHRQLQQHSQISTDSQHFYQGLALSIAMLVSAHLVSDDLQGLSLSISSAYMILYLVNTIFRSFPKLVIVYELKRNISNSIDDIQQAITELNNVPNTKLRLTHLNISFHQLTLPHGCQFSCGNVFTAQYQPRCIIDIRGPSGSGKSTLIRCLLGNDKPHSGEINIAGVPSHDLTEQERRGLFAYLGQESRLYVGSLKDNLLLLAPKGTTKRQLWDALEVVQLDEKAKQLPLGLDTPVLSAAASFSTGECQRILLAQLLFKPAKFLVLDEALSGIPETMEMDIINKIKTNYSFIIRVSHRVALHQLADEVIAMGSTPNEQ
ncbi:MAG: ATP-binding cassette domain-containing protein [Parashewanella sp.]